MFLLYINSRTPDLTSHAEEPKRHAGICKSVDNELFFTRFMCLNYIYSGKVQVPENCWCSVIQIGSLCILRKKLLL